MKKIFFLILDKVNELESEITSFDNLPSFKQMWENLPHTLLNENPDNDQKVSTVNFYKTLGVGHKILDENEVLLNNINNKSILDNEEFINIIKSTKEETKRLHVFITISTNNDELNFNCLLMLIEILKDYDIKVVLHLITKYAKINDNFTIECLQKIESLIADNENFEMGTIAGSNYALDYQNIEKTKKYYELVVNGIGLNILNVNTALENCHMRNLTDNNFPPMIINKNSNIQENDSILWLGLDKKGASQTLTALLKNNFTGLNIRDNPKFRLWTLFKLKENVKYIFQNVEYVLYSFGQYLADLNLNQSRIALSECFDNITNYFDDTKKGLPQCNYFNIQAPINLPYEDKIKEIIKNSKKILEQDYDFILANFNINQSQNLGKTSNEFIDNIVNLAEENFYKIIILLHDLKSACVVIKDLKIELREKGHIEQVMPTILNYMDISLPKDMKDTKSLLIDD